VDAKLPQGRDDCPRCAALEERVRELEAHVAELLDRLRANSSNSSTAPSSDPLWAPRLKPKKPTGKKPGGQPGHQGHHRKLLPVEEVDRVVQHVPAVCEHCQAPMSPPPEGSPPEVRGRHQVAELPPRAVIVTEHQSCACRCGQCGKLTVEPIPEAVRRHCTGERLSAALCYLSAFVHGSRRAALEVAGEMLGCPLSLGTIVTRETEMAAALLTPYRQVQEQVRTAQAKNVDETGWRRAGRWLWVAATPTAALFHIDRGRNWHALQNLLGELVQGTVCSDRHGTYERLKLSRRGICWAHLKRDFQRWVDRGGGTTWLGKQGLTITRRGRKIIRSTLHRLLRPLRRKMSDLLQRGEACGVSKAKHFCRNLRKVFGAMWTFARVAHIEPTNNHAERMLRPAVIWRKTCFGSHSTGGCRYAERMLTAIQTLRLNGRLVMQFLTEALAAHRQALPTPSLI
jgi:transposase